MTNPNVPHTPLGASGPRVFPIGLGCMGMSSAYGPSNDADGIATIVAAIERGVTLFDTGDFYGMGHNEMLIRRAIEGRRDRVQLSVKFGVLRTPDGGWSGGDTRPEAVKNFAAYSLKRLGVDVIDVYRPARLDPKVPIEDTVGAVKELVQKGYVRHLGLSEVGVETIRRAHRTHPVADLQIEYSILSRSPEDEIFPLLHELGIGATLYSVLGRGQLAGKKPGPGDFRNFFPRFSPENRATNDPLIDGFMAFARGKGMTPGQLAVAWALAKEPRFVPVIGARTIAQIEDALGALENPLTSSDLAQIEKLVPKGAVAGTRYAAAAMASLDSER